MLKKKKKNGINGAQEIDYAFTEDEMAVVMRALEVTVGKLKRRGAALLFFFS